MARMLKKKMKKHSKFTKNAKYNAIKLDKKLNKKIRKISNMIELKYIDTYSIESDVSPTGWRQLLNNVGQGTQVSQRVGDQITMTSLQIRGSITSADTQELPTEVRMIVFMDKQSNNTAPNILSNPGDSDGLLIADSSNIITNPYIGVISPFTYEQQKRFRILYDKRFVINNRVIGTVTDTYAPQTVKFKAKIKLNKVVKYGEYAAFVTGIATNSLFVVFLSDTPNAPEQPSVSYYSRVYYKDA